MGERERERSIRAAEISASKSQAVVVGDLSGRDTARFYGSIQQVRADLRTQVSKNDAVPRRVRR